MFVKKLSDCKEFTAKDGCKIRELLHPKNEEIDLPYSVAVGNVAVGNKTIKHTLEQKEVYYLLAGKGRISIDEEAISVQEGDVIVVPADSVQWIENTGQSELEFMVIVSPPWTEEGDVPLE